MGKSWKIMEDMGKCGKPLEHIGNTAMTPIFNLEALDNIFLKPNGSPVKCDVCHMFDPESHR